MEQDRKQACCRTVRNPCFVNSIAFKLLQSVFISLFLLLFLFNRVVLKVLSCLREPRKVIWSYLGWSFTCRPLRIQNSGVEWKGESLGNKVEVMWSAGSSYIEIPFAWVKFWKTLVFLFLFVFSSLRERESSHDLWEN